MIYVIHLSDGRTAQVHAANELQAKRLAIAQFRGRLIEAVTPAGLLDLTFRRPPAEIGKTGSL
jgi:hypothetical protein